MICRKVNLAYRLRRVFNTGVVMKHDTKFCIEIKTLCEVKGSLHTYFIDPNNIILACNKFKADFFRDMFSIEEIIGRNPAEYLTGEDFTLASACNYENPDILKKGLPKQCYHSWTVKGLYRLDLLTFKIPVYDPEGKPLGIFAMSHILNKISAQEAHNLGLTKRETECLLYLFEGYTAKEIAKAIKLSPRTVEGYIDNMKVKLNCATTSELLLKASQNKVKTTAGDVFSLNKLNLPSGLIVGESAHNCVDVE